MKVSNRIYIVESEVKPAGGYTPKISLATTPIDEVIKKLNEGGINIRPEYSSADTRYGVQVGPNLQSSHQHTVQLPDVAGGEIVKSYTLRDGIGLSLMLQNYHSSSGGRDSGVCGGSVRHISGVSCDLVYEGDSLFDSAVIGTVRSALNYAYMPLELSVHEATLLRNRG